MQVPLKLALMLCLRSQKEEAEAMGQQAPLCFYIISSPLNSFTFNPCATGGLPVPVYEQ